MKRARRAAVLAVLAAACLTAAGATGLVSHTSVATADAPGTCDLGSKHGQIKHVVYLQFDNTHYNQDRSNVASDLQQMPNLLNFLKDNGTLLTNDHTILISHTAGGILSSLTGLYPDRNGTTVSNSYDYFSGNGTPVNTSSFKYWTDTADGFAETMPNMVGDGGQTAPAPWVTYTHAGCNVGGVSAANIELENSTAIRVTSLSAAAAAGATNVKVGNDAGMVAGQQLHVDDNGASPETVTITSVGTTGAGGTGITFTPALTSAHAQGARVWSANMAGDMTKVFGVGSPEWNEARDSQLAPTGSNSAPGTLALTDFVGIAIHCALSSTLCDTHGKPDDATTVPGSNDGYKALFGAKYVNPAINNGNGCVKATDGSNITDQFSQCGFPGFDGALAKNTLGEVAQMQEHGVPVTFAYISDAHDNHQLTRASGPGEFDYQQQLAAYNDAFGAFFQRLRNDGIDKSNTLFVVTVDEGDHFAGGVSTIPDPAHPGAVLWNHSFCSTPPACPANQIGEVNVKIGAVLPANEPAFDIHFDDAPTFYVNGQPERTNPTLRQLERDVSAATAPDPYAGGGPATPIAQRLADPVEEQALHMINADPKRTPSFTMFGNPDFFFQTTNLAAGCNGATVCVNPGFAWNHGDVQDEIANTWAGMVGPGVEKHGIDNDTWTDHVDLRPTINELLGLQDDYVDDGRVITQIVDDHALSHALHEHKDTTAKLGDAYKQINAPFGQFAKDTLTASTAALKQPDSTAGNLKYDQIEASIANLTLQRNALAGEIRQALNDAAAGGKGDDGKIDDKQAKDWIKRANDLLDQAHALALANPVP
jgi:hypothetical protein